MRLTALPFGGDAPNLASDSHLIFRCASASKQRLKIYNFEGSIGLNVGIPSIGANVAYPHDVDDGCVQSGSNDNAMLVTIDAALDFQSEGSITRGTFAWNAPEFETPIIPVPSSISPICLTGDRL